MSQVSNKEALVLGTGEVSFCPDAKTVAQAIANGMEDLGALAKVTLEVEKETQDQYIPNRGIRVKARSALTQIEMMYKVTCQELKRSNLVMAMAGKDGTNFTQSALTAADGEVLAFNATSAVIGRWYQLRSAAGAEVRDLSAVTIAALTEGTDFVVDKKLGRIRFLTAQAVARTPVLTAPAIVAGGVGNMKGIKPLEGGQITGVARIHIFDDNHSNKLVYDSGFILVNISVANFGDFDGENFLDFELDLEVTEQLTDVQTAE